MMKPARTRTRAVKVRNLTQQKTDFTAEGAPPPGLVAGEAPVGAGPAAPARAAKPLRVPVRARR